MTSVIIDCDPGLDDAIAIYDFEAAAVASVAVAVEYVVVNLSAEILI